MSESAVNAIEKAQTSSGIHYRNPTVPSGIAIPGGLVVGTKCYISGSVDQEPTRFALNLQRGFDEDGEIHFHANVRFDDELEQKAIVRNARFGGEWGQEERDAPKFPFVAGASFVICITATAGAFEVQVNGEESFSFANRNPEQLTNVTHLVFSGSVRITEVHIPFVEEQQRTSLRLGLSGGAKLGDIITVKGATPSSRERFHVNLQCGPTRSDDVVYHFNPRFNCEGKNLIVCNNKCDESWGEEEYLEGFQVSDLDQFELSIAVEEDGFHTFLNKTPINIFKHRVDFKTACSCFIEGDVEVSDFTLNSLPNKGNNGYKLAADIMANPIRVSLQQPLNEVVVSGRVEESPTRFAVSLQIDESGKNTALHFNPRWDDEVQPQVLVLNHRKDGAWDDEQREAFPGFRPNLAYDLIIKAGDDPEVLDVYVNGGGINNVKLATHKHPFGNEQISFIAVDGSFRVNRIAYSLKA